jgi:hypothetical protein
MRRLALVITSLLSGCVMGIPDSGPAPVKHEPCQIWVVQQPDNTAVCVSRDEWERYWKPVLIPKQEL